MSDETQPTMRDTLSAAYDAQVEAAEQTATPAPEPVVETKTEAPAKAETTGTARPRDEHGRFAPKTTTATEPSKPGEESATAAAAAPDPVKAKADGADLPPVPSAEATSPKVRPPQSWKPAVRELAAKLPAEFHPILEEVDRREREITKSLSETAQARQFVQQFQQTIQPYEAIIRANGHHPMQTVGNLLQTAATLQLGTPQQKAAVAAQVIKGYGIDIDSLAQALEQTGQPAQQQARPPQYQDPAAIARQVFQEQIAAAQQARQAKEVEAFRQGHEFFDDVRDVMADLVEAASRRGQVLPLEEAYKRAVALDPELSKVLDQRKAAEAAKAQAAAAEKAKAAASSVRSSPVQTTRPGNPQDRRAALEAAYDRQISGG